MKTKRTLVPGFINKLDKQLLINKPVNWSARTHLVAWFALLFAGLLSLFCLVMTNDPRKDGEMFFVTGVTIVVSIIGLIFWLIYLLRFNPFKRFGLDKTGDALKTFLLYFLAIGSLTVLSFIPSIIESYRANRAYTTEELRNDMNSINLYTALLEKDSLPNQYYNDTLKVVDSFPGEINVARQYSDDYAAVVDSTAIPTRTAEGWEIIDTAALAKRKMTVDSVLILNDSTVVFGTSPDLLFVGSQARYEDDGLLLSRSKDIFRKVFHEKNQLTKNEILGKLSKLVTKYNTDEMPDIPYYYQLEPDLNLREGYEARIREKYKLTEVNYSFHNIAEKKYRWDRSAISNALRVFYYVTLAITLLVFIFRHTTVRTFFLSLLSPILLSILTGLILSLTGTGKEIVYLVCLLYFALFIMLSLLIYGQRIRKLVNGIALNLFVFLTPFFPLMLVAYYYAMRIKEMLDDTDYNKSYEAYLKNQELYTHVAEIAGTVLFLVLLEPVFKKLYRKWYSSPQE